MDAALLTNEERGRLATIKQEATKFSYFHAQDLLWLAEKLYEADQQLRKLIEGIGQILNETE